MKVTASSANPKYVVYDAQGNKITYATSYDTKTCEIEVFLCDPTNTSGRPKPFMAKDGKAKFKPVTLKGVIEGSYLEIDGVRYVGE